MSNFDNADDVAESYQDGFDESMAARIMAKALGFILQDDEGIAIDLNGDKYVVYASEDQIHVAPRAEHGTNGESIEDGRMLWMHQEGEEDEEGEKGRSWKFGDYGPQDLN